MSLPANFDHNQIVVGAAAVQLDTLPKSHSGLVLKAMSTNTGKVYIGKDNTVISTNGFELEAGDALPLELINAHKLWAIASAAAQRLCWAAVKA